LLGLLNFLLSEALLGTEDGQDCSDDSATDGPWKVVGLLLLLLGIRQN